MCGGCLGVHQIEYFPFLNGGRPCGGGYFKNTYRHVFDTDVETRQFLNGHRCVLFLHLFLNRFLRKFYISRNPMISQIREVLNNQDNMQKINVVLVLLIEIYRVLMGALLVSFVPQNCDGHICSPTENLYNGNDLYIAGFVINFLTLLSFLTLYGIETKRENRLIAYLDVNPHKPNDSDSVREALMALPESKRENILYLDKIYQKGGYFVTGVFVLNTVFSGIVVFDNYLDSKTVTAYLTNVLFMASKVYNVYSIANTEENVFYSAYLSHKLQYNEVDPDKIADIVELTGCSRQDNLDISIHGDIEMYAMENRYVSADAEENVEAVEMDDTEISE
jgi:hypothetical protein